MKQLKYMLVATALLVGIVNASVSLDIPVSSGGSTTTRHLNFYAPSGLQNPRLVILMHGAQGNGDNLAEGWGWDSIAMREKLLVATPSGNGGQWDLGGNSDIDFIVAIIDTMANRFGIDRNRVYATGWSMGGMMSYYLACHVPDKFAAMGPSSGYPIYGESGCSDARNVPIYHIHGIWDDFVKYSDLHDYLYGSKISRFGCPTVPDSSNAGTRPDPSTPGTTLREYWGPCQQGGKTSEIYLESYWKAHSYGNQESEVFWNFLRLYSLNSPVPPTTTIYQYGDFHGRMTRLTAGDYTHIRLIKVGIPDSIISSIRVDAGLTVQFFDNDNFQNPLGSYSADASDLSAIKNKVTAIRISSGPVVTVPAHRDSVFNGGFDLGAIGWTFNTWEGGAQGSVVGGEYKIQIDSIGQHNSGIQLVQNGIILEQGKSYEVTFDAYASAKRTLEANVEQDASPWTSYLPALQSFDLTTTKTTYSYAFNMTNPTDSNGRVTFNAGASTETVFLDNISIKVIPTGIRASTGSSARGLRWSSGVLLIPGTEFGKLQIIDTRGRSKISDVAGGKAYTGSLPAGVYQARLLDGKQDVLQRFTVLP
jgi:pimeloyl-ACP methyl ester carboxylesterase